MEAEKRYLEKQDGCFFMFALSLLVIMLAGSNYLFNKRITSLEKRAAWFMPEGQQHPEPVKPEIEKD